MASEIDRVLAQYGQGYTSPALNSGDGEIASTPDILAQYGANERMASGIPGFLRRIGAGLRSLAPSQVTTPVNTLTGREPNLRAREDHANPLMLMGGEGADTMASWIDMHPGVDRGQSRPQDLLAPLGAAGMGLPFAVQGAAGVFGGRLARTADREALSRAEEMATRGADRREIWDQTGWFQGRDGQWRFEINDQHAHIPSPTLDRLEETGNASGMAMRSGFNHPELYDAYPELRGLSYSYVNNPNVPRGAGSYDHGTGLQGRSGEGVVNAEASRPDVLRSVALHELQHAIQRREDFAPGGNSLGVRTLPEFRQEFDSLLRESAEAGDPRMTPRVVGEVRDLIADGIYRRLAGEVEARNVQSRRDFSPAARDAVPPWRSQDTPDANQILAQYSQGPQMSAPQTKGGRGSRTGEGAWRQMNEAPEGELVQVQARYVQPEGDTRWTRDDPQNPFNRTHTIGARRMPDGSWVDRQGNPVLPAEWRPFAAKKD